MRVCCLPRESEGVTVRHSIVHYVTRIGKVSSACLLIGLGISRASAQVVINEIHHDPEVKTEPAEFIELHNAGTTSVNLSGWYFSDGIQYTFPSGASIAPGGYVVVAESPATLQGKFAATALGPWVGNLDNDGERIVLRNASGGVEDEVEYQLGFPWPTVGDAPGYSIELVHPS